MDVTKEALYDFDRGGAVLPIEINGKVAYKLVTDAAVVDWFLKKMYKGLDMDQDQGPEKPLNKAFIVNYDLYRFLRSIERTGELYYLTQNAKAMYLQTSLQKDKKFQELFNRIARDVIQTQEPGVLKGPALLGGVYSSPLTVMSFLDLLMTMSKDKKFSKTSVEVNGRKTRLGNTPLVLEAKGSDITIKADPYTIVRIDREKEINILDYADAKPFFTVRMDRKQYNMGDEGEMVIELNADAEFNPAEYYAIIAVPSTMSVKQTEDLLSDYKGQLIYGTRTMGSDKIQLLTVPFRGSKRIVLKTEAAQKGKSGGYVLVRHISNPDILATVRIEEVKVK